MFNDALMEIVAKHRGRYELPLMDEDTIWIVPMSGGADSSCLAILMKLLFPRVNFEFVFTDTGDEDEGALETLNAVEEFLQIKIYRVAGEKSLYELIDDYSGFLPVFGEHQEAVAALRRSLFFETACAFLILALVAWLGTLGPMVD
jgi:tRNA(Ile)-lysidine synthase TilS/MesJ